MSSPEKTPLLLSAPINDISSGSRGYLPITESDGTETETAQQGGKGNLATSIFNLANAAIGAGVLAFPYAYSKTGLGTGLVITAILVILLAYSVYIISWCTQLTGSKTYQELVFNLYGRALSVVCELILLLYTIGAMVAYMKIIGDMISPIVQHYLQGHVSNHWFHVLSSTKFIISIFSLIFIFPLCLLRRVDVLGVTSFLAVLSCSYMAGFITVEGAQKISTEMHNIEWETWNIEFFAALPLITFAYQCHILVPPVYAELNNHNMKRMGIVIFFAMSICCLLYIPVGVFGYLAYGSKSQGDILLNYDISNIPATVGRGCIALTVTLAYPINNFPARLAIFSLLFRGKQVTNTSFYIITIVVFLFNVLIAMFVPGITLVFDIIGSTLAVAVIFIFPGMFAWTTRHRTKHTAFAVFSSITLLTIGLFIGLTGTGITIYNLIKKKH